MNEIFFELGTEEIPARLLERARNELVERVTRGLDEAKLAYEQIVSWATPRRLAFAVQVADKQEDRSEELTGPPARVAFDDAGNPTKAAIGFAKRNNLPVEALFKVDTPRGEYLAARVDTPGVAATELLPEIIVGALEKLTWPKSMRWGSAHTAFIRPVHWIIAISGGQLLPLSFAGIDAGRKTRGHRFMAPAEFEVTSAAGWVAGLRAAKVEPEPATRRAVIAREAERLAAEVGCTVQLDPGLLDEVTSLVEWPVPLLGSFEESYLDLPPQLLVTPMKHHQRYFPVLDAEGRLSNHFVVVASLQARDPGVVVRGNGYVLRARLADARFFYDLDRKRSLEEMTDELAERTFLQGLGTMRDKAGRLETLAGLLAAELAPGDDAVAAQAGRAGFLAKADLSSEAVGEFPELQGEMGREYARLAGEPEAVAQGIFEHYLPRFAGDELPSGPVGAAVALADKLDTMTGCFALGLEPTGSADPYALRRSALGIVRVLEEAEQAPTLSRSIALAIEAWRGALPAEPDELQARILGFFRGRQKATLSQEFPTDLTEAVLTAAHDDPRDVRGRLAALTALKETDGWDDLAIAFKRVVRIAVDAGDLALDPRSLVDPAEQALYEAFRVVHELATEALDRREYRAALERLIALKPAIDKFFDDVMVMSEVAAERERRLALLAAIAGLFHRVADFEKVST